MTNSTDADAPLFSTRAVSLVLTAYVAVFASLTVFTHLAQLAQLTFHVYATVAAATAGVVTLLLVALNAKSFNARSVRFDWQTASILLALGLLGAYLSAFWGIYTPDDAIYASNPIYYLDHPHSPMGFEVKSLYSGGAPFLSVSFLVAGAYEYVQAVAAHWLAVPYVKIYSGAAPALAGFVTVLALFRLIARFSRHAAGALIGTFVTLLVILMLGDTIRTPGGYLFMRNSFGRGILCSAGVYLLVISAWEYLERRERPQWWRLFLAITALSGMSTSAFMILPILGLVIFAAFHYAFAARPLELKAIVRTATGYFSAYWYLVLFALFVNHADKASNAVLINATYPSTFAKYAEFFVNPHMFVTPLVAAAACIAVLVVATGRQRLFLGAWMLLAVGLALNPWSGAALIRVFKGVYFRLFYILPFPPCVGMTVALLYSRLGQTRLALRLIGWTAVCVTAAALAFTLPSSALTSYGLMWDKAPDLDTAYDITRDVPPGVMLAPYELSHRVRMFSSLYPQMIVRKIDTGYFLTTQGRVQEAVRRREAQLFLAGAKTQFASFAALLEQYPEIRSVAFDRAGFVTDPSLERYLLDRGFTHSKDVHEFRILWR